MGQTAHFSASGPALPVLPAACKRSSVTSLLTTDWDTLGVNHFAFRASRADFLRAQEELKQRGIPFQFADHVACHSIYFKDPDGPRLEVTTYELA